MEVVEKRIEESKVAYIPHKGSYDKIPELMQEVGEWLSEKIFK